jgi:hypothetical protein
MADESPQWLIDDAYASPGKFAKFAKKNPMENTSLFSNLQRLIDILNSGHKIGTFKFGWFRAEKEGVYRVGQSGMKDAEESRLYIYPDDVEKLIYILNIGTKNGQGADINAAVESARVIRKAAEKAVEGKENQ